MTTVAAGLLRLLGGAEAQPSAVASPSGVAGADFASLLDAARAGRLGTAEPASIADGAGVSLTAEQLHRIGAAADRARSEGAAQALVLIDGMALRVDVLARQVKGAASLDGVVTGIDAVVSAPATSADSSHANASLLRALGTR